MNLNKPPVASVAYSTFMWLTHSHLTLETWGRVGQKDPKRIHLGMLSTRGKELLLRN